MSCGQGVSIFRVFYLMSIHPSFLPRKRITAATALKQTYAYDTRQSLPSFDNHTVTRPPLPTPSLLPYGVYNLLCSTRTKHPRKKKKRPVTSNAELAKSHKSERVFCLTTSSSPTELFLFFSWLHEHSCVQLVLQRINRLKV